MLIFKLFSYKHFCKLANFLDSGAIISHGRSGAGPLIVAVLGSKSTRHGNLSTVTGIPLHQPFLSPSCRPDMTEIL